MPAWLALEAKDSSRSCQKSVDRTMKAIKKLMFELNYQKDKKSIREMYFHIPDVRDEEMKILSERKLQEMQAFLDANQWALYRVESI